VSFDEMELTHRTALENIDPDRLAEYSGNGQRRRGTLRKWLATRREAKMRSETIRHRRGVSSTNSAAQQQTPRYGRCPPGMDPRAGDTHTGNGGQSAFGTSPAAMAGGWPQVWHGVRWMQGGMWHTEATRHHHHGRWQSKNK
jgi:hypothetical protein